MADYIERQAALHAVNEFFHDPKVDIALNAVPVASVREDVQAEWVDTGDHTQVRYCSRCGVAFDLYAYCKADYNFCPSCGARMVNKP